MPDLLNGPGDRDDDVGEIANWDDGYHVSREDRGDHTHVSVGGQVDGDHLGRSWDEYDDGRVENDHWHLSGGSSWNVDDDDL